MEKLYSKKTKNKFYLLILFAVFTFPNLVAAQSLTSPQVNFTQRTAATSPAKTIYNINGDFTMLGNTNLTLVNYDNTINNESNFMKYVDVDGDSNTLNSSMATLELSNSGENSANQDCSTVIFAGLYWTGKSQDADTFTVSTATHGSTIPNTNYTLNITRGGTNSNRYPIYTFTGNGHSYVFNFSNAAASGTSTVTLTLDGISQPAINVTYNAGRATFTTPFTSNPAFGTSFTLTELTRATGTNETEFTYRANGYASINNYSSKNYDKKVISLKGPGATSYTSVTSNSDIYFPGSALSGIFIGYQEVTDYVKTHGSGAYTVADIALIEGTNSNPGYFGGWVMIVIYENPLMKSRAVTLFDGCAYVNGQRSGGGEFGNIPISGFTTVDSGPVNMKLGVMAAEGDVGTASGRTDYLAVQKLNADPTTYNTTNYLTLNHANNTQTNFFNSSIFPQPAVGTSNPILQNNTGVDFSMFTIPNADNLVIGNNQSSTTFRFGSNYEVYSIFGFAMSVDSYVPEPKGLISVNSINNVTNPTVLNALPGQAINYALTISNSGTEAINNTIVSIPIPETAIFNTGGIISFNTYHNFNPTNPPAYDEGTNSIVWNLGTLPITAGHPEYIYADLSFNLNVTDDCSIIINEGCNPRVSLETGNITGVGAISGNPSTEYFFQGYDDSECKKPIEGSIIVAIDGTSCLSTLAGNNQITSCGSESVQLEATSGSTGLWSIINAPAGDGEIFSDITSPNSEFYSPNNGIYTLRWTVSGAGECPDVSDDVEITFNPCSHLDFDGTDDNVNFKDNFNFNSGSFSIEVWIKSEATNGNIQTILSKRNAANLNDGYDLRLVNNIISFHWNNGNSISSNYAINTDRWYHVAVTFDGNNYYMYVDGVSVHNAVAGANPIANSNARFILGAMAQNTVFPYTPIHYFDGWMEELRIWNVALTEAQIHQMMNQKIQQDNTAILGSTVPLNIPDLSWNNLEGYYQMVQATDLNNGYLIDKSANIRNGKLLNIYTPQPETAPLPYTSTADGVWETNNTWTHGDVWNIPNTTAINNTTFIDWNIVKTDHNITTAGNKTVLGLLVTSNVISANSDNKIEISHYLKLDGKIDLVNKSQLVQTQGSVLDVNSSGTIERDQQGQSNLFNYNYWSSPVGGLSTTANNINYSVGSVMKDGTTTTPQNIKWVGGDNGAPTTPISTARYWLFKFDNYANAYANWVQMNENSTVRVGQGYTMKGSGAATPTQNYTFVGKPNNGLINSNSVSDNQLLLAGNPYPCSLDSYAFINDNVNSINGSIYFWEHYASNNSHFLKDYQGGYAIRNLTGGVAPSSANVDFISKQGTPSRGIPNRFIPVGQAFLLIGKSGAGGTITYDNNQRAFHKEDDAENSNVIFKVNTPTKTSWRNSDNDAVVEEKHKKIRLGFTSYNDYHRQLLLGFIDEKATDGIDFGYDAHNMDNFPNDMFFLIGGNRFVIQGVGAFDKNASYPIGVKTSAEGTVKFMIDEVDNFDPNQAIYIFDSETNVYNNIREKNYEVNLTTGINTTRFSLRFYNPADAPIEPEEPAKQLENENCEIIYIQKSDNINVNNSFENSKVKKIRLYNSSGVEIENWKIQENRNQSNIQVHIKKKRLGLYIVKVETTKGDFTKKIIIQ
ncbi:LamG-like jellyroll fold domain-containing protein [Flavobacterium sp. FBOR7N2.3]|uniref:LamG-like jellyroll fold domain-containing protein n=1 Tax=Flavobacterium magnesitis TaxID=3138077 RepID=A0ABV4TN05_9FLAO